MQTNLPDAVVGRSRPSGVALLLRDSSAIRWPVSGHGHSPTLVGVRLTHPLSGVGSLVCRFVASVSRRAVSLRRCVCVLAWPLSLRGSLSVAWVARRQHHSRNGQPPTLPIDELCRKTKTLSDYPSHSQHWTLGQDSPATPPCGSSHHLTLRVLGWPQRLRGAAQQQPPAIGRTRLITPPWLREMSNEQRETIRGRDRGPPPAESKTTRLTGDRREALHRDSRAPCDETACRRLTQVPSRPLKQSFRLWMPNGQKSRGVARAIGSGKILAGNSAR